MDGWDLNSMHQGHCFALLGLRCADQLFRAARVAQRGLHCVGCAARVALRRFKAALRGYLVVVPRPQPSAPFTEHVVLKADGAAPVLGRGAWSDARGAAPVLGRAAQAAAFGAAHGTRGAQGRRRRAGTWSWCPVRCQWRHAGTWSWCLGRC